MTTILNQEIPLKEESNSAIRYLKTVRATSTCDAFSQLQYIIQKPYAPNSIFKDGRALKTRVSLPLNVRQVFATLFGQQSTFLNQYSTDVGNRHLVASEWQTISKSNEDNDDCSKDDGIYWGGFREVSSEVYIAPMAKWTQLQEQQRFVLYRLSDDQCETLSVFMSSATPNIMYGDCFRVETLLIFQSIENGSSTIMDIVGYISFLKYTLMKSLIERATFAQLPVAMETFSKMAKQVCEENANKVSMISNNDVVIEPKRNDSPIRRRLSRDEHVSVDFTEILHNMSNNQTAQGTITPPTKITLDSNLSPPNTMKEGPILRKDHATSINLHSVDGDRSLNQPEVEKLQVISFIGIMSNNIKKTGWKVLFIISAVILVVYSYVIRGTK